MSVSSFPHAEHVALLRHAIEKRLHDRGLLLEVSERGLNQMKCQYRFCLRRQDDEKQLSWQAESVDNAGGWAEFPVHFQIVQRLEEGRGEAEFDRILENFLLRNFPGLPSSHDVG